MSEINLDHMDMNQVELTCPVDPDALRKLKLGDLVYLTGTIFTGREGMYHRWLDEKIQPPVPLNQISNVNFHCSPAAVMHDDSYNVKAVTGTASFRFGKWFDEFFTRSGVKIIIGKGGLTSADYKKWFVPHGAVYLTTVGYGLGATYGHTIKKIPIVHWLDELGIAQAIWVLEIERMGPFIVEGDSQGNSLFEIHNARINEVLDEVYGDLPQPVLRRYGEETDRRQEVV
jgi:L(+)-tartrate dehydratase beta subunit